MGYKHGTYGEILASRVKQAPAGVGGTCYIGTAPIHLIRGFANKELVNFPVKLTNMRDVQNKVGYSEDWTAYTLCEAFAQHFANRIGNIGPIFVVNVLDPTIHIKSEEVSKELAFSNDRCEFESTEIILDSFEISGKTEGVDYELDYNFESGKVIVKLLKPLSGNTATATYNEVDPTAVTESNIIGSKSNTGVYTGLAAFELMYQAHNEILKILCAPGWSESATVYKAMVKTVKKLNNHWDGMVLADIPIAENATIESAKTWQKTNSYLDEQSKVFWPMVKDTDEKVYHLSTVAAATMLKVDTDHDGVPFETPSNKEITACKQYFGEASTNKGFDQDTANSLNEKGITTACFWGGKWVLWGPHTAAFDANGDTEARAKFDVNIRMLMYITNQFQLDHGTEVDAPLSLQKRDSILNAERQKLDGLVSVGALLGTPEVLFLESSNPTSDIMDGDFVWDFAVTNTPPLKSMKAKVAYTDEGFESLFE